MKKCSHLFLLLMIASSLASCQKAREKRWCKNPIKIPQRVVDYFYFKEGTYWIYENETTHEVDSQWVCYSKFDTLSPDDNLNKHCNCIGKLCYQKIDVSIASKKYNGCKSEKAYLNYLINFDANQVSKFTKDFYVYKMKYTSIPLVGGLSDFCLQFYNDDKWELTNNLEIQDTSNILINNFNYKECIKISNSCFYSECYLSRRHGYIRFTDINNNNWNLIRKSIVQ